MKALLLILMLLPSIGFASQMSLSSPLQIHSRVFASQTESTRGTVLYFHGYGDRFENHQALFQHFQRTGFQVVAFDLPSHGQTVGSALDDLDFHSFPSLALIASQLVKESGHLPGQPLVLAGWSLGGLIATRIAQSPELRSLFPPLAGLILYAPGISVRTCVGNSICHITNPTLTHDVQLWNRPLQPRSPLYRLGFASQILFQSLKSQQDSLPTNLRTLLFVGGDHKDRYVKTQRIKQWVVKQRQDSAQISAVQCPQALHELDNELDLYGGAQVRQMSANSISAISTNSDLTWPASDQDPCHLF